MEDSGFLYLIAGIISLIIMYYIIKDAVISGTKELLKEMKLNNDFKMQELRKQGFTEDEINGMIQRHYQKKKWFGK
jgi:hypothetical protein